MVGLNEILAKINTGIGAIPMESVLNIALLLVVFTILYLNPYKFGIKDMINWWKQKLFRNPSIHRVIFPNGDEKEYVLNKFGDKIDAKYDGKIRRTYFMNQKYFTRRNKVPIYTHLLEKAEGVDFFNQAEAKKLDSEKFHNIIHNAKIDVDMIKQILQKKELIKYLAIAAICIGLAALFSFQGLNVANAILQKLSSSELTVKCSNIATELATK